MEQRLYFWALIPDSPVQKEISAFKEEAAQLFHAKHALRSPAHVTLLPPLRKTRDEALEIDRLIQPVLSSYEAFELTCNGFASFPSGVIYVDMEFSELLQNLYRDIMEQVSRFYPNAYPFTPHLTVAFRDLDQNQFPLAKAYFSQKDYSASWSVDGLWRLALQNGLWKPQQFLPFKQAF